MGKMYYSEEEATRKLGVGAAELTKLVQEGKLHAYADGAQKMFKVEEVDVLAPAEGLEGEEIELTPADTSDRGDIGLAQADQSAAPIGKEDTVITTDGISIFDDEDLEVEAADPMAKTSIAPTVGAEISADGVGSGSGLLDLTREPDDTSLGAVLEDISVESAVGGSVAAEAVAEEPSYAEPEAAGEGPAVVEEIDPSAGVFSGLIVGCCLLMLVMGAIAMAVMLQAEPPYLKMLQQNLPAFLAVAGVVAVILALAGYFIGKSAANRAAAMQRGSGS